MKSPSRSALLVITLGLVCATSASAHPGHDDGHELVWEASHWVAHPLASLLCVAVVGSAIALGIRMARRARSSRARPAHPGSFR